MSTLQSDGQYLEATAEGKIQDVKILLDPSKPNKDKLEGMKRLIAMVSRGVDVSAFFPNVVKNVICDSVEVKKLVYMFLVHYAETQPDLALLSINNFQKDLSDSNQFIRALSLRVMCSIRVKIIAGLQVLAAKKCASDVSPYVRKTAAHALAKAYRLDTDQKDQLVEIVATLLGDKSTLVLGGAVAAMWEICPDRHDLIHPHYRKLCHLLADLEEWGQVLLLNLLTRYARTQFVDPLQRGAKRAAKKAKAGKVASGFYSDQDGSSEDDASEEAAAEGAAEGQQQVDAAALASGAPGSLEGVFVDIGELDPDHRLLLKAASPLLQSRNSAVVMAVSALFAHAAPTYESVAVGKGLVRTMRANKETQYVVLANAVTLAALRPSMFEPHVKQFFVVASDPAFVRPLKLEMLTLLAKESNIAVILREFKEYVKHSDKGFVAATIQAIGRCATSVPEVAESCLHGLMGLLSNSNELVVAEAVVVVKTLLQKFPEHQRQFVSQVVRLLDSVTVVSARSAIVWTLGEHCEEIPLVAPDALRKLAKSFPDEADATKLQVLNLGAKLQVTNPAQTSLLFQYVMEMARYDMSYDVRDRARVLRLAVLDPQGVAPDVKANLRQLLLASKPAPVLANPTADRARWTIGSLSHIVTHAVAGFSPLPEWPSVAPDGSAREPVRVPTPPPRAFGSNTATAGKGGAANSSSNKHGTATTTTSSNAKKGTGNFYSDDDNDAGSYYSDYYTDYYSGYSGYSDYYSYSEDEPAANAKGKGKGKGKAAAPAAASAAAAAAQPPRQAQPQQPQQRAAAPPPKPKTANNLIDFDFDPLGSSASSSAPLVPMASSSSAAAAPFAGSSLMGGPVGAAVFAAATSDALYVTPRVEVLNRTNGGGLTVEASFTRAQSLYGPDFNVIRFYLTNNGAEPLMGVKLTAESLAPGQELQPFSEVAFIPSGSTNEVLAHVNFQGKSQAIGCAIVDNKGKFPFKVTPPVGELLRPVPCSDQEFDSALAKLGGMHEASGKLASLPAASQGADGLKAKVLASAHISYVSSRGAELRFASRSAQSRVYIQVTPNDAGGAKIVVNADNALLSPVVEKAVREQIGKD